jgi:class 3 adenylate cyclase
LDRARAGFSLVLVMLFVDLGKSAKVAELQRLRDSMLMIGRFAALVTKALTRHKGRAVRFAGGSLVLQFGENGDADQGTAVAIRAAVMMYQALATRTSAWSRGLGVAVGHSIGVYLGPAIADEVYFGMLSTAPAIGDAAMEALAATLPAAAQPALWQHAA